LPLTQTWSSGFCSIPATSDTCSSKAVSYCSLPILHPPILLTTLSLKWGGGLYSNIRLVLTVHLHKCMDAGKSHDDARNSSNIGHALRESSQVCWYCLQKSDSEKTRSHQCRLETKVDWVTHKCV